MRWPWMAAITVAVTAVHGWIIWGPWQWLPAPDLQPLATPSSVEVALLPPPAPPAPQAVADAPPPPPRAKPQPKPKAQPVQPRPPQVPPPPAPTAPSPALPLAPGNAATAQPSATEAVPPPEADAPLAVSAEPPAPPPAVTPAAGHPAPDTLQVRNAQGQAHTWALPTDGSALSQNMELRFKVHGFVKGMEYHANATLTWQARGDSYTAHQSISAFLLGSLEQRSQGHIGPQGLQPVRFEDRRLTKRRYVDFVWERGHALFEPVRDPAPIGTGTQDRLSVFLQLASMLNALPSLREKGTQIDIPTMGSRRLQTWSFQVEDVETLDLPAGPTHSLRLQRLPQPGDDEHAQIWLAPELGFVPVRIRMQEGNGDHLDLTLKSSQ